MKIDLKFNLNDSTIMTNNNRVGVYYGKTFGMFKLWLNVQMFFKQMIGIELMTEMSLK